jgi:hypothetical protein
LVLTGILKERGGDITEDDEWLSADPMYREPCKTKYPSCYRRSNDGRSPSDGDGQLEVSALWSHLPQANGKYPAKDAPWICFPKEEHRTLEKKYRQVVHDRSVYF